ncbi:MAG: hypothetical protein QXX17_08150 [Conexivisphaerales archaeon]
MRRIETYDKYIELKQLKTRVQFLKSDLPRVEDAYKRFVRMTQEAETDLEWMQMRLKELEEENERLKEMLASNRR